jgi:hypothetical protein
MVRKRPLGDPAQEPQESGVKLARAEHANFFESRETEYSITVTITVTDDYGDTITVTVH